MAGLFRGCGCDVHQIDKIGCDYDWEVDPVARWRIGGWSDEAGGGREKGGGQRASLGRKREREDANEE